MLKVLEVAVRNLDKAVPALVNPPIVMTKMKYSTPCTQAEHNAMMLKYLRTLCHQCRLAAAAAPTADVNRNVAAATVGRSSWRARVVPRASCVRVDTKVVGTRNTRRRQTCVGPD
eukprot:363688-Chlamydomonas_euryale.AAC.3